MDEIVFYICLLIIVATLDRPTQKTFSRRRPNTEPPTEKPKR